MSVVQPVLGERMKILAVGDEHRRRSAPAHRLDDYAAVHYRKSKEILQIAVENDCRIVLYPGDVYDTANTPHNLLVEYLDLHNSFVGNWAEPDLIYGVVWGQHDQRYHTTAHENTPLGVLCAGCKTMKALTATPYTVEDKNGPPVHLYGASWGEEIPEVTTEGCNILVTHRMVIPSVDKKAWATQTEDQYTVPTVLLTKGFSLIVAGDNHGQFVVTSLKHRASLINAGSVMRSSTAQIDHTPAVYVYDTVAKTIVPHFLRIADAKKVFNLEVVAETKEKDTKMETFVAALRDVKVKTLDFTKNLKYYMETNDIEPAVKQTIAEMLPQE